jgi:sulfate adenylyltransferase (ADP) / ATP adenylyltransferase
MKQVRGSGGVPLAAGALPAALERATRRALAQNVLHPIECDREVIDDGGVRFVIRRVSSLARREFESRRRGATAAATVNPFLPFDPDLFVADLSTTHVALLNKFNIIPHHMLVVTRSFMPQEALLDARDIAALSACLAQLDGLVFYNGGAAAGASQPHKHLQVVPLPLGTGSTPAPIDAVLATVRGRTGICVAPGIAFPHSFAWLDPGLFASARDATAQLVALYPELLRCIGISAVEAGGARLQSRPYNLLVTRRWILAVPRVRADFAGVPVNALGFAGSLFVSDHAGLATIRRAGPMAVLRAVSGA